MSTELLDWVGAYLEQDEEIIVPITKMWNEWSATHGGPSLDEFTETVLGDGRFEEMRGVSHTEGLEGLSPEELEEEARKMEALGYFSGPRVKLKSRKITMEHVARMIQKHNDRMEMALHQARWAMPDEGTAEERGMLADILVSARRLRQHLREAGLEPDDAETDTEELQSSSN